MKGYVDREKIFPNGVFFVNEENPMASIDELINRIHSLPDVDCVEVVRCKYCVHSKYPEEKIIWCRRHNKYMPLNGYCNYGDDDCNAE